jgi:valyl-tRNA synthetase
VVAKADRRQAEEFEELKAIVTEARALVKSLSLSKPNLYYSNVPFLAENAKLLARLGGLGGVQEVSSGTGLQLTSTAYHCWLDVDISTLQAYSDKLSEQIAAQERVLVQLRGRLENKSYVEHAPRAIVAQTKEQLKDAEAGLERLQAEHDRFTAG